MKKLITVYAVRDKTTGKLVTEITSPSRKIWLQRGKAQLAINNYPDYKRGLYRENLEVVELHCYDEEISESIMNLIDAANTLKDKGIIFNENEMTHLTPEEEKELHAQIESKPLIGVDGRPINILNDNTPTESRLIPKKPLPENKYYGNGRCPRCGVYFIDKSTNYCGNCGQALDWGKCEENSQ